MSIWMDQMVNNYDVLFGTIVKQISPSYRTLPLVTRFRANAIASYHLQRISSSVSRSYVREEKGGEI